MKQVNDSTERKKWKHISYTIKLKIEVFRKVGCSAREIAERIGYSLRTVQQELARGAVQTARTMPDEYAAYGSQHEEEAHVYERIQRRQGATGVRKKTAATRERGLRSGGISPSWSI